MTRGRSATSPLKIPLKGWLDILARVGHRIGAMRIGLLAAGVAFYGLLSFFPAVTAGLALLGVFIDPAMVVERSEWLVNMLPQSAGEIIMGQLADVAGAGESTLGLAAMVAIGIALWSASNAVGSLMQGLNVIYEEDEERGFIRAKLLTIGLTLALIFGLAVSVIIVAAIPAALSFAGATNASAIAQILRWPIMFAIGIGGIAMLYRFAPDRRAAKWRWLTPGALASCALWVAGTVGFSYYVQSFGGYNETFGALAGVIILLTWMWLSAFVVLLGALLDAEIEAQTQEDSTIGDTRPMGERGAFKADSVGAARGQDMRAEEPTAFAAR
ncbi:MAG: YihY/virulence factor BrkB family protein [Paracoccaceae bacterium]